MESKLQSGNRIKRSTSYKVFTVINICIMLLLCLVTLYPYLNVLAVAFNDGIDTMLGGLTFYPRVPTLENFKTIFRDSSTITAASVSLRVVVMGTLLSLLVNFSAAYALKKKHLYGRRFIIIFFMIPMFLSGGLIAHYLLYAQIHLLNNILVYFLPGAFGFYNMVIIRTYMYTIPNSLEESAKLDGANEIQILFKIILPLCKPIIATMALWSAVGLWNTWTEALYFITKSKLYTLQFLLWQYITESQRIANLLQEALTRGEDTSGIKITATPESIKAAQLIITTLPIITLYPFLQKYFIQGVLIGSIKE